MTITLISMHKPNFDEQDEEEDYMEHEIEEEDEGCCSSYCMKCTGLSWRDFM